MNQPLVSIVVPVYNTEQYLRQCLDSLINQSYRNLEIICVNDESPDNSPAILNDYASRDKRIKVFSKRNGGLSDARNYGMRYASGEYFMFLDSDDWLDINAIEECINIIMQNSADCVMFGYTKEFASNSVAVSPFKGGDFTLEFSDVRTNILRRTFGPIGQELSRPQDCDITVSACMQLFKSEKFRSIEFYDNRKLGTFEDGIYQIDVFSRCNSVCYIDKPFYHYRKTNLSSITSSYNPVLPERWKKLFDVLTTKANEYAKDDVELKMFHQAIYNRIAIAILPLGLNEVRSNNSLINKGKCLAKIINDPIYKEPLASLRSDNLPVSWKIFFTLAKKRMYKSLAAMLSLIEYIRTHYQK